MVRLNPRSLRVLNQDGAPDAMQSVEGVDHVGAFLKEARETTGRTVVDVAQTLRIRRVYLEAIEDGRFDELPGSAYAVGFVRSYATYLRLDVQAVVARFKEEATGIEAPQELDFPTPVPEGRFPGGVVVTLCLLIVAAGAGGWYWWQSQKNIDIARVPPPQEVLTGASDTPVASLAPAAESATANAPAARDTSSQEPVADATGSTSDNAPAVAAAVAEAPTAPEPQPEPEPAPQAVPQTEGAETVTSATAPSEAESSGIGPVEQMAAPEPAPTTGEEGFAAVPRDYTRPAVDPVAAAADQPDLPATEPVDETPAPDAPAVAARSAGDGEAQPRSTVIEPVGESGDATPAAVTPSGGLPAIPAPASVDPADADSRTYGSVNRNARIVLSAREENTWVQVMDSQENALLTQMLRPGDKYLVPDRPGLSLRTNNAGGLDISVDGSSVPAIGGSGDIRREVRLDPELLKSGSAVVE